MKKLLKIISISSIITIFTIILFITFLKFYFKDETIIALLKPKIEEVTRRKIVIEGATISLFKGIILKNISLKEKDEKTDFIRAKELVISYELFPLLNRKLIITSLHLEKPFIHIVREKNGTFNFSSLLRPDQGPKDGSKEPTSREIQPALLPISITIQKFTVSEGLINFTDQEQEIPNIKGIFDADTEIHIDAKGDIFYKGSIELKADAHLKDLITTIKGQVGIDPQRLTFQSVVGLDKWDFEIKGNVSNYTTVPHIILDLSTDNLNVDELFTKIKAVTSKHKTHTMTVKTPEKVNTPKGPPSIPPIVKDLKAKGTLSFKTLIYKGIKSRDVRIEYQFGKWSTQSKKRHRKILQRFNSLHCRR